MNVSAVVVILQPTSYSFHTRLGLEQRWNDVRASGVALNNSVADEVAAQSLLVVLQYV